MTEINDSNIQTWVDRFMAADTSVEEEKAIYAYFSRADLPERFLPMREMFGWYDSLPQEASCTVMNEKSAPSGHRRIFGLWQWVGIAAMLAMIFTIGYYIRPSSDIPDEYLAYSGSYIMRDGKKITDLRIVVPEIERMEREIDERLSGIQSQVEGLDDRINCSLTSGVNMANPDIRDIVESSL